MLGWQSRHLLNHVYVTVTTGMVPVHHTLSLRGYTLHDSQLQTFRHVMPSSK